MISKWLKTQQMNCEVQWTRKQIMVVAVTT